MGQTDNAPLKCDVGCYPISGHSAQTALRMAVSSRHAFSVLPEILEPLRGQLSVPNGVLDIAVSKVGLQGARVVHVWVRLKP